MKPEKNCHTVNFILQQMIIHLTPTDKFYLHKGQNGGYRKLLILFATGMAKQFYISRVLAL
jgi:hypothetical protein